MTTMVVILLEWIQALLHERIEQETREPVFRIPVLEYGSIGLVLPHPTFWKQMVVILSILTAINAFTAVTVYYMIVLQRGSASSYLVGYGLIFPMLLYVPLRAALFLGVHNTAQVCERRPMCTGFGSSRKVIGISASLTVVVFRCMMAIHNTLPPLVDRDVWSFVSYYVSPLQFQLDTTTGKVIPSSPEKFSQYARTTLMSLLFLGVFLGLMIHVNFELVPRQPVQTVWDLFQWQNIVNNYAMGYLMGRCLDAGTLAVGVLLEGASGKSVILVSNNPLTQSTSPSDFWGRRWNELVHIVLKTGGVYIPMRKNGFSRGMAGLATFAVSGLFHEYILVALTMIDGPTYGNHLNFFLWNAVVIILENLLSNHPVIQWTSKNLPRPIITALVLLTALPISHWFTDEYLEIGFFHDFSVGFPFLAWYPSKAQ
ncbi:Pfam:DUF821 [Seminavis robusta]|uniref:Pfam:DUF821 n=1 Tax=Seminavis robusta TaxID=568900 RepID=A0A9N8H753_9STRA|nr:Pfam:DUF821 [Seminavis robusta]|eukprot:Sro131_g062290.1 Pfam:DUF821 (427) ;mRNA; r:60312-62225